jgi:hypothetical protein
MRAGWAGGRSESEDAVTVRRNKEGVAIAAEARNMTANGARERSSGEEIEGGGEGNGG